MKAIETRYAGCRFRSRLEARWAVFFDTLNIAWQYEPQGFEIKNRLFLPGLPESWNYLPDFYLPGLGLWAEVKGYWRDEQEPLRFMSAAAQLSTGRYGAGCMVDSSEAADVILLGAIPNGYDPGREPSGPKRFHMHKGDLVMTAWMLESGRSHGAEGTAYCEGIGGATGLEDSVAADTGSVIPRPSDILDEAWTDRPTDRMMAAYAAARSARFEHGESGAS